MTTFEQHASRAVKRAVSSLLGRMPALSSDSAQLISTNAFASATKAGGLQRIFVQECASGFALFAETKGERSLFVLSTPNNLIRNWASLNSLIAFLHRHEIPVDEFTVRLNKDFEEGSN
jgi:hypothetical protein